MRNLVHPGEILSDELAEVGVTPTELARQLCVPDDQITQLLQGGSAMTGDMALRLGHWFANSPAFWTNLQSQYDLAIAERTSGAEVARLPRLVAKD